MAAQYTNASHVGIAIFAPPMRSLQFVILVTVSVCITACSEYNKVLKSSDIDYKYTKAVEYLEEGKCFQALPIFEELIGLTRGSQRAEQVYYYHAKSHYCANDFYMANYYFNNFVKNYSFSPLAEECQFLAAKCSYNLSPNFSLDQTDTKLALNELQLFMDRYPSSSLRDSCATMVKTLDAKLEKKSYEIAKLYVKTEQYKSATIALQNAIKDYPNSPYREEMMYLVIRASHQYAERSIDEKKSERFSEAINHYFNFVAYFPESEFLKTAESYYASALKEIERMEKKNDNL